LGIRKVESATNAGQGKGTRGSSSAKVRKVGTLKEELKKKRNEGDYSTL